jgi:selenocysteine-specific elongation factor
VHVVATAGHVDHGKSTLVRALTGRDPDRLEEEHQRGLSIELGYCWTDLDGVGEVAFVDVPGHEKFIATTLAGLGQVPVVMFVVAADDPWMPQAAEHLAALDALGVSRGLLVVTRSDLSDPTPALERARSELDRTSLAGAPAVVVSGQTGQGIDDLRRSLVGVLRGAPEPDPEADVRLWVDRRFHVRGAGTVVTGTLPEGTIAAGDTLTAGDQEVRVRGIEALEVTRTRMSGTARVALNLGGHAPTTIGRGTALTTPRAFRQTSLVDVRVHDAGDLPEQPLLHVGSASVAVHARPLGTAHARLRLEAPLPLRIGDQALLRDPGSRRLWGVRVVDPLPPPLARRGAAEARADELAHHDGSLRTELDLRGAVRRSELVSIGVDCDPLPEGTLSVGDWLVGARRATELREQLGRLAQGADPLDPPLTTAVVARRLELPGPELAQALVGPPLRVRQGVITTGDVELPADLSARLEQVRAQLADDPFDAPDRSRLRDLGLDNRTLAALERAGHLLRVADDVVLLPGADAQAIEVLRGLAQPFTASEARQALGTTRRVALPLLDHLDRRGHTVRLPDDRRRLRG